MSRQRISLPIRADKGRIVMVDGSDSDLESILHHIETKPSTQPMRRMLGTDFKYHTMMSSVFDSVYTLRLNMYRYESDELITDISMEFDEYNARVLLKWRGVTKGARI